MGVTGLWTVLQPCARPIKIEALNKKRLAIDASIWIYQFLKAVRDKEGNALRNSHVVGFFRRICKLLYFGIMPVFVFDGGAPLLKRETIGGRKSRREGKREDAVRTAGKLLAVQMQRRAEEEETKRRDERDRGKTVAREEEEEELPEELVYVDELQMTQQERTRNRVFRKTDAYHLPELQVSLEEMGGPDDPRVMSREELKEYARQFHTGDVSMYDFSKIDFNSSFFQSLPAGDRYNILNAARLRSRLRMGYSKEQLESMFPDRMAFSKFQIERVAERNELTQRLMNINSSNGTDAMLGLSGNRVAGEKGKEYVLVKNDGVDGGWALGVVSNKDEGHRNRPIDVEEYGKEPAIQEDENEWEDNSFEDVPIQGLNRLPKRTLHVPITDHEDGDVGLLGADTQRKELAQAMLLNGDNDNDAGSLFLPQEYEYGDETLDGLFIDDDANATNGGDEYEDIIRAIAMSLEQPEDGPGVNDARTAAEEFDSNLRAALDASRIKRNESQGGSQPVPPLFSVNGTNRSIASPPMPQPCTAATASLNQPPTSSSPHPPPSSSSETRRFDGPLPFESLDLGNSILGRKTKKEGETEEAREGFEKMLNVAAMSPKNPLPPWFSADMDIHEANAAQRAFQASHYDEKEEKEEGEESKAVPSITDGMGLPLENGESRTIDDTTKDDIIEIVSSSSEDDYEEVMMEGGSKTIDSPVRSSERSDLISAVPHLPNEFRLSKVQIEESSDKAPSSPQHHSGSEMLVEWEESDLEPGNVVPRPESSAQNRRSKSISPGFENVGITGSVEPQSATSQIPQNETAIQSLPRDESLGDQPLETLPVDDEETYSDPDEQDLMRQLATEAEEHARFASTLNSNSHLQTAEDYEQELRQLRTQQKKDRRDADGVSQIMITECQQLLKLFGLPYVTAPMEAEAQCAELVSLGLVDGIVTDDSDIFLFGGTRVYKNMFNQAKFVECYLSADLEKEYSLDRQKLISIAHLLGSDYTEGLPTIGPVTALEILSEFETLEEFADWCSKVQMGQPLPPEDAANPFRKKFKRNAAKIMLPTVFPDKRVNQAYLHPEVDSDPSAFAWGVPDLDALRQYLMATIGWTQERTDEVLVPVIKDMNRREDEGTQANITQFFGGRVGAGSRQSGTGNGGGSAFAPRKRANGRSKRMESALDRLKEQRTNPEIANVAIDKQTQEVASWEVEEDEIDQISRVPPSKPKSKKRTIAARGVSEFETSVQGTEERSEHETRPRSKRKRGSGSGSGNPKTAVQRKTGKARRL